MTVTVYSVYGPCLHETSGRKARRLVRENEARWVVPDVSIQLLSALDFEDVRRRDASLNWEVRHPNFETVHSGNLGFSRLVSQRVLI